MMVRLTEESIAARDQIEEALFALGSALVYLDLIDARVRQAAARMPDLMRPAIDDLVQMRNLIREGQSQIGTNVPVAVRARSNR
jgi:hypothetical protein